MKKNTFIIIVIISLFGVNTVNGQNIFPATGSAGIGTITPHASSLLEMTSTTKGLLIPRMSKNDRDNIPAPATGLLIYQTNGKPGFYYYDGTDWQEIAPAVKSWSITGNAGTVPANNFIGTTDSRPLAFRVNNQAAGIIDNASGNTSFGYETLLSNSTGTANTAHGYQALLTNTTGSYNTATGWYALRYNTTGTENTATGSIALYFNSTGSYNTANGNAALVYNTTGGYNTASGWYALAGNTTGNYNTAVGGEALYNNNSSDNTAIGYRALFQNTSGAYNTAMGLSALGINVSGSYNTAIGYVANVASSNLSNATAIGFQALADASNKVRIGNTAVTSIGGQVAWTSFSDGRIKKDIKENVPGLAFIKLLRPVTYHVNVDKENELLGINDTINWKSKYDIEKVNFSGFIAQDVQAAAKKIGYDFSGIDNTGKIMGLRYSEFVVPLVKAVQELAELNEKQEAEYAQTEKGMLEQIDATQKQIDELRKAVCLNNQQLITPGSIQTAKLYNTASLFQNTPNPFSNSTTIHYTLPQQYSKAKMIITDQTGKTVKEINLSGKGKGSVLIDATLLSSGAYHYSLYVDSKLITDKQMIVSK